MDAIESKEPLVLYHGGCRDGFCAAWVVSRVHHRADFVAVYYGQNPPECKGRHVIIVDFSYPAEVMRKMASEAKSVLVLDHHKTAKRDLASLMKENIPNLNIIFSMKQSGAGLAWSYFFPKTAKSWIVACVEDRDLWNWKIDGSRAINAYLSTVPFTIEAWQQVSDNMSPLKAIEYGRVVLAKISQYVKEVTCNVRYITFEGHKNIPVINASYTDISEVLDSLCTTKFKRRYPLFAVGWFQRGDGKINYSLRSRNDFDVSAIAKKFGGGGHKNAAGFESTTLIA